MAKRLLKAALTAAFFISMGSLSQAGLIDVNVNVPSPELSRLGDVYSATYGFPKEQITPILAAPQTEIPMILQIAKKASLLPIAVWQLKSQGIGYANILKQHKIPFSALFTEGVNYLALGSPLGSAWDLYQKYGTKDWPETVVIEEPTLVQLAQVKLFTDYLKIEPARLIKLPSLAADLNAILFAPQNEHPAYFVPPGLAKKGGLPPGQAKKQNVFLGHSKGGPKFSEKHGAGKKGHGGGHGGHHGGHGKKGK